MDQNLKREIILDHYQNPRNRGLVDDKKYEISDMDNESCIDHVTVQAKVEENIIKDIHFDGEACAICTSSASIMSETLKGKNVEKANQIISNYYKMIDGEEYDKDILEEANVYEDIAKQPNRKKCALLAWWGIGDIVTKELKDDKGNN
ncbi:MAG: SUF system NifU family Fe-S cluster assembly protein [Bacilli bacterium]|nr:SUF system NifU family Fe-S cluster assembly protein [Bacilli bacterium]